MRKLALGIACTASMLIALAVAQGAAAAPATAFPECPHTITNADNGATITLVQGSCATLSLDPALDWSTPTSSSTAIRVFDHETLAPDQQWGLGAVHRGTATVTSTGRPHCDPGQVCPLYVVLFTVHIRVIGPYAAAAA